MIEVVNKRRKAGSPVTWQYIGRPNPLGNPYKIGVGIDSRNRSISLYRMWLGSELKKEGSVRDEFDRLMGILKTHGELTLVCWCAPLPCHGDVLKEFLEAAIDD